MNSSTHRKQTKRRVTVPRIVSGWRCPEEYERRVDGILRRRGEDEEEATLPLRFGWRGIVFYVLLYSSRTLSSTTQPSLVGLRDGIHRRTAKTYHPPRKPTRTMNLKNTTGLVRRSSLRAPLRDLPRPTPSPQS